MLATVFRNMLKGCFSTSVVQKSPTWEITSICPYSLSLTLTSQATSSPHPTHNSHCREWTFTVKILCSESAKYMLMNLKRKKKGRKEKEGNEGRMEGRKKGRGRRRRWREGGRKEGKILRSFHLFLWWNVFNSFLQDISKVWMITMFIPEIRMNWNPSSLWELIKVKIWIKYHFLLEAQSKETGVKRAATVL